MEIAPGIHHLKFVLRDNIKGSFNLLVGEELGLIDTGTPPQVDALLSPYCRQVGLEEAKISVIVNTHWHHDHMGGDAQLKALSNASVMAHRLDAAYIENPLSAVKAFVARYGRYHPSYEQSEEEMARGAPPAAKVDRVLEEGDEVRLAGRTLQVYHTPGHTAGSISFYERATGILFSGDALQGSGSAAGLAYYVDLEPYLRTLDKVEQIDIGTLIVAHDYRPFCETVLRGDQVRRFLRECRDTVDRYDDQIVTTLEKAKRPLILGELTQAVLEANGLQEMAVSSVACVLTHLERLTARGALRRLGPGPEAHPEEPSWALG